MRIFAARMLAGGVLGALAGCRPALPPSTPLAQLTPQESRGQFIFQAHCAECHDANDQERRDGPGLQGLYKKRYLPSGAPANDERVFFVIRHGRASMPAFGNDIGESQLRDLIAYLHTL